MLTTLNSMNVNSVYNIAFYDFCGCTSIRHR